MISEIFRIKGQSSASSRSFFAGNHNSNAPLEKEGFNDETSHEDKYNRLYNYKGVLNTGANNLYLIIRNLYALSRRSEILKLIVRIIEFSDKPEEDNQIDKDEFNVSDY